MPNHYLENHYCNSIFNNLTTTNSIEDAGYSDHLASIKVDVEDVKRAGNNVLTAALSNGVNARSFHVDEFKHHKHPDKA